jgi:DNA polymerase-3 subunit alpha
LINKNKYMTKEFCYPCGCSFKVLEETKDFPRLEFTPIIEDINLECSKTWELISDGNTKGCFQLESRLGRSIAKKLKPENIEQLSALISILRPGCLEAIRDGKSVTNHYIDKKNGKESIDYYHPALEPILKTTYGEMVYQEQAMEIAKVIAGFNLQEADMLRKAIGKKKPEEMAKVKEKFLSGAKLIGKVSIDEAEEIFGWIEKSQRYSFNKSHSVSYAINAYLSAYTKAHFPKIFFASYLRFAKDKIDPKAEIKELVQNASEMDINVYTPDIRNINKLFILKNNGIYFGLTDIKGFGNSVYDKLLAILDKKSIEIEKLNWIQMLCLVLQDINSTAAKALIKSGALSYIKKTRNSMLFEYELISQLTKKELEYINKNIYGYETLDQALSSLIKLGKINKKRLISVQNILYAYGNPPYSLDDNPEWISDSEEEILGCSITCSKIDMYDISMTNTTCKDFKNGTNRENIILCAEINNISVTKTKTGKNPGLEMAFVTMVDSYGVLDSVVFFPEQYRTYRNMLFDNNVVIIKGNRSKTGDSLIVEKAYIPKS